MSLLLLNFVATIKIPPRTCVTLETTINKGGCASVKKSNFRRFCHQWFSDAVRWRWNHRCYNLAMVTLVSPLHSKWHWHCRKMPMVASLKLSSLARGPGPPTNVRSVSESQQSTLGCWTAINIAFECSRAGTYNALTKTYFKLNNSSTNTMYKWPTGSGDLFFTDAFTKQYCRDVHIWYQYYNIQQSLCTGKIWNQ